MKVFYSLKLKLLLRITFQNSLESFLRKYGFSMVIYMIIFESLIKVFHIFNKVLKEDATKEDINMRIFP